jgi:transcriptional regulator with XRE-family HTH domain
MVAKGYKKQHAFAVALNVSQSTVTRWLANGPMSLESAADICSVLNISLDWLVLGRGEMESKAAAPGAVRASAEGIEKIVRLYEALPSKSRRLLSSFLDSLDT